MTVLQTAGLSHSEIPGSKVICTYPRLIAAYHVLLRLHEPRHPPCALSYFLYDCCVFLLVVGCWLSVCYLLPSSSSFTFTTTAHTFSCIFVKSSSFGKLIHSSWNLSFTYLQFCLVSICQRSFGNEEFRIKNEECELLFSLKFLFLVPSSFPEWRITDSNRWPPACKAGALASWANPPRKTAHSILLQLYWMLVVPGRLELPTSTLSVWRSNQLSYRTVKCRDYVSLLRGFILYKQNSAVQEAVGLLRPNLHILQCVFLSFFK